MLLQPGERTTAIEEQCQKIKNILSQSNQIILVVEHKNQLIGNLGAYGGNFQRNCHSVYLVVGILQVYTGHGIGTQLFEAFEEWALTKNIHRLELRVKALNERAIHLYQKMGFEIEGIKKDSHKINGKYVDEYYMAKILSL